MSETREEEIKRLVEEIREDVNEHGRRYDDLLEKHDSLQHQLAAAQGKLQKAERTLIGAGYQDLGGEIWKPPLGDFNKTIERFREQDELVLVKEQLRRLTLFAQGNTNLVHVDDLCEHGAESGCCSTCSAAGPRST